MSTKQTIQSLVDQRNSAKLLFTAGPASLLPENLTGLQPCFGRGDQEYLAVEADVLNTLMAMSGHKQIVRMQGSASLALEMSAMNYLTGDVLIVATGYYSDRLHWLAESARRRTGTVKTVTPVSWQDMDGVQGQYDWVWACPTETSCGLKIPIDALATLAERTGARLMLDATASIGLESGHHQADVIAYSSCKGLFGLTGACFIAFNELPDHEPDSFYLNLGTHLDKKMTGPYHAILSLADVLPRHDFFRESVVINKERFLREVRDWLSQPAEHQPFLCTHVRCHITSTDPRAILYQPRNNLGGSVVCHLGEVHLGGGARGDILGALQCDTLNTRDMSS
ncbi:aminotransferase class V-fold PLP-dependent enzyme [Desulfonatronum thiodismutans]|uniref:aminotransferase class V-fold PLP-dependent enzyme n=1 Tax=Desulfonatronum thiodismutans TaxID=159290 RepID=UPI00068ADB29|nr:aminotransferase class V-fold PLP-dependent enzyme [Desulfonatronum thiodismutans]